MERTVVYNAGLVGNDIWPVACLLKHPVDPLMRADLLP